MQYFFSYETEIGTIFIGESSGDITFISTEPPDPLTFQEKENPIMAKAAKELKEYLIGKRKDFSVSLSPQGTPFQQKVWQALLKIPYGETRSYQQIGAMIGSPKGCRAVGMANHNNPIMIMIPCHRVIGANGNLTGYAGGLDLKRKLLDIENAGRN